MSSSFDVSTEAPVGVGQVLCAFRDEDYWLARMASYRTGTGRLESLLVDADGNVTVATTVGLLRDRLPKIITTVLGRDLKVVWNETWARIDCDRVRGEIRIAMARTPVSGFGTALLTPAAVGSRLKYTATVEVKVPLVGRTVENYIGGHLAVPIGAIQRFTTEWITGEPDTGSG